MAIRSTQSRALSHKKPQHRQGISALLPLGGVAAALLVGIALYCANDATPLAPKTPPPSVAKTPIAPKAPSVKPTPAKAPTVAPKAAPAPKTVVENTPEAPSNPYTALNKELERAPAPQATPKPDSAVPAVACGHR